MKFTVSSGLLSSHLQVLGRVIASKNTLPILECFLFELKEDSLTITAADNETRITSSIEVSDVEGGGEFASPAKSLLDSLKELPEQPIKFEIDDESFKVSIFYENEGEYGFIAQNGEEYPLAKPLGENTSKISISAEGLTTAISRTLFATAEDELRPVMNGIYFDIKEEDVTFVASDGHKLVRFKNLSLTGNTPASFILPKKPANLLKTILPKESGEIEICFDENNAYITLEKITIVTRLIEGRYPNYNGVIPKDNPFKVNIDRLLLLNALKRVSVFANSASSLIKLSITENKIVLSAHDLDFDSKASETVACIYESEPINIGFKGTYLIEILNNIPSSEISIELADPSRAGLILPSENESDEDLLMLLMPMMLND
ncbi:MAG: DNA polymerase III subunit beta [Dysgonamonadaceae bacterium]|jgi:DNA polymerase-3 subunit beta|nr:DNA polymerase III subunit beta [Dysgonamonadaceae bacterium]